MRNLFLIAVLTTTLSFTSFAQSGNGYGIKAGLNYNGNGDYFDSVNDNFQNPDRNVGFHIGIFGKIGDNLYFKPELMYTSTKSDYDSSEFTMKKLDAPLLVGAKIMGPLSVFGGPSLQYILDSGFNRININNIENDFSVGLNFGVAVNFKTVGIDLRYERGFSENEARFLDNNGIGVNDRLDTRPDQLILSVSLALN